MMKRTILLMLLLLCSPASARLARETVTVTNAQVRGLEFNVVSAQQIDNLKVDITVTQTDGGDTDIREMSATVSLGRRLMLPVATTVETNALRLRLFVSPDELPDIKLVITHSFPILGTVDGCVYTVDLLSFIEKTYAEIHHLEDIAAQLQRELLTFESRTPRDAPDINTSGRNSGRVVNKARRKLREIEDEIRRLREGRSLEQSPPDDVLKVAPEE
jgi:hypothetical protein